MGWLRKRRPQRRFEVDDVGVRRLADETVVESVEWEHLAEVSIRTTSGGPWQDDVFFLLGDGAGRGVVIDSDSVAELGVLERLQALPGFDNLAVIEAMGCRPSCSTPVGAIR